MARSTTLRRHSMNREFFDPTNTKHVESLKKYISTGNWEQQFYPEFPFLDVPSTVQNTFIAFTLGVAPMTKQMKFVSQDVKEIKIETPRPNALLVELTPEALTSKDVPGSSVLTRLWSNLRTFITPGPALHD